MSVLLRAGASLARALAAATSILAVGFGLWFVSTLMRGATPDGELGLGQAVAALLVVLGVPVALALWRHPRAPGRALAALAYLPTVWNGLLAFVVLRLFPDAAADALREHGAHLAARRYGDTAPATRVLSAMGQRLAAGATDGDGPGEPDAGSGRTPPPGALEIPFRPGGSSILVDVVLAGPGGRAEGRYVFDTGASYTTISRAQARAIGIAVPDDAPVLEFHTAAGPVTSPVVFLPELHIDGVRLTKLAVAVCDDCVSGEADGLLGLNVVRRFLIQTDYVQDRMILLPRSDGDGEPQAYDIQAMSRLSLVGPPDVWLGTVHWVVRVQNLAPVPLEDVVPAVRFVDGPTLLGRPIERIAPGASATTLVKGQVGTSDASFVLELARARW